MGSNLLDRFELDRLTPSRLWSALDPETRLLAARALYGDGHDDAEARRDGDRAIAEALRFRLPSVRKLPLEKRAAHLSRIARPDDSLATALLITLHLVHRQSMLSAFLDRLDIPNDEGTIDPDHDLVPPDREALSAAADELRERFPASEVDVYLAALAAMDPEIWGELARLP